MKCDWCGGYCTADNRFYDGAYKRICSEKCKSELLASRRDWRAGIEAEVEWEMERERLLEKVMSPEDYAARREKQQRERDEEGRRWKAAEFAARKAKKEALAKGRPMATFIGCVVLSSFVWIPVLSFALAFWWCADGACKTQY